MSKEVSSYNSVETYFKIALSFSSAKFGLLLVRHPIHVVQTNKQLAIATAAPKQSLKNKLKGTTTHG